MSKERLIEIIIKAKFDENPDAKLYEPVSTDVLFLLQKFYDSKPAYKIAIAMSKNDYIKYGYSYGTSHAMGVFFDEFDESFGLKTLNEDGSPTKIKEWGENHCDAVLKIIDYEWWLKKHNMDCPF